nr:glycosyltransferase [Dysgonomonas sp. ZJ709]
MSQTIQNMQIPKIIHQIWSGVDESLPKHFEILSETWKEHHPSWRYIVWNNQMMNLFVQEHYPLFWDVYSAFQYNIQRWDAIRYLILDKLGGMYVDFDYECLEAHDSLLKTKICCFASEPGENGSELNGKKYFFNNALMASVPNSLFMKTIIDFVFSYNRNEREKYNYPKGFEVLITTGPIALNKLYEEYESKSDVYIIPSKHVSPITSGESRQILLENRTDKEIEEKFQEAYSVHYFFSEWMRTKN